MQHSDIADREGEPGIGREQVGRREKVPGHSPPQEEDAAGRRGSPLEQEADVTS